MTLAKIHFSAGRSREGIGVLERLLQRNPTHPVALELLAKEVEGPGWLRHTDGPRREAPQ